VRHSPTQHRQKQKFFARFFSKKRYFIARLYPEAG
jgi:hypothetical protein